MNSLSTEQQGASERALATAQWMRPADTAIRTFNSGKIWLGRAADEAETPVGYGDDRHVLLVAGNRSGKGTSAIVPNLCMWPGSMVVIDPKGENATITAARRGSGSDHCDGLEQNVYVLDPFKAARVPDSSRAAFNPLDLLDPSNEETVDDAVRIADAIVIAQNPNDAFWDEQAKTLLKALILHVITFENFEGARNLVTVRQLIISGDQSLRDEILAQTGDSITAHAALFSSMRLNQAFHGIISGAGEMFGSMIETTPKTFAGLQASLDNHTSFIDSIPMRRLLAETTPGFTLARLKTDPLGISIFLSLPQRFMNTHFRWLRMMASMILTEMEKTPGLPASGAPVLLVLDEFAGLRRMEIIENAAAQIAGFGVKMFFIVQALTQLKTIYKDNWEIFIANAGTRLFFGTDDQFTREYVSKYLGEMEITRTTGSRSQTSGTSRSETEGSSNSSSSSTSTTEGGSSGISFTHGSSTSRDVGILWDTVRSVSDSQSKNSSSGSSWSNSSSYSSTYGTNYSKTNGISESESSGTSQGIHKRALLTPDEIGLIFSRIDDKENSAYPGLMLVATSGNLPMIVRRTNYYEDHFFERSFDPHPDHGLVPLLAATAPVVQPTVQHNIFIKEQLYLKFGVVHTQKAYQIIENIRHDYPQLVFLSGNLDEITSKLLDGCLYSIEIAAKDGRAHTMTQALEIAQKALGRTPSVKAAVVIAAGCQAAI